MFATGLSLSLWNLPSLAFLGTRLHFLSSLITAAPSQDLCFSSSSSPPLNAGASQGLVLSSLLFSICIQSCNNLIQPYGFIYVLWLPYVYFQPRLFPESQIFISDCLFNISASISYRYFKLNESFSSCYFPINKIAFSFCLLQLCKLQLCYFGRLR